MYADVLTSVGDLKDGKRRITQSNMKKKSDQYLRRVRDGSWRSGWRPGAGPWCSGSRGSRSGPGRRQVAVQRGGTGGVGHGRITGRVPVRTTEPCALVRVSRSQVIGGKTVRTQESVWLLKGVGLVRTELQNDVTGRFAGRQPHHPCRQVTA